MSEREKERKRERKRKRKEKETKDNKHYVRRTFEYLQFSWHSIMPHLVPDRVFFFFFKKKGNRETKEKMERDGERMKNEEKSGNNQTFYGTS